MNMTHAPEQGGHRCSCTALRKASRRISQFYDAALASAGLKTTQRAILAQVHRSQPTTVGKLAETLVMDSGGLTHTLKPLERDGYIATATDPADRRNRLISLTALGLQKLTETEVLWAEAEASFEAAMGPARLAALRDALTLLISDEFSAHFTQTHPRHSARPG